MKRKASLPKADRSSDKIMRSMRVLVYAALMIAMGTYPLWFNVINQQPLSIDPSDWASFGDFFGGTVGPFIGFASIVLLVETLKLQQRGLKEQREQLQQSAKEVKEQNRILMLQSFEQSFFSWLKDYKEQIEELHVETDSDPQCNEPVTTLRGRHALGCIMNSCFHPFSTADRLYNSPAKKILQRSPDLSANDIELALKRVLEQWVSNMYLHADWLGSMLRTLYSLFSWIDEHKQLSENEKQHYASIVRARLSNAELRMLFIDGMTTSGRKFAKYINKYSLFCNLPNPDTPALDAIRHHPECPYTEEAYTAGA
jgi:gas vesicle protein